MTSQRSSARITWIAAAALVLVDACSFDESKLRRPPTEDAAGVMDVPAAQSDAPSSVRGDVATSEIRRDTAADVPPISSPDGSTEASTASLDGGQGGTGGIGGDPGADGGVDTAPGGGGQDGGEAGSAPPVDAVVDDGSTDSPMPGEDSALEDAGPDDLGGSMLDGSEEVDVAATLDSADSQTESEVGADTLSVDARGKRTCPTTISGSLDRTDPTQVGRLSRVDSASVCGTTKPFPGNGADKMYSHLYDAYSFINVTSAPVCFTFTLTYGAAQELYLSAYSDFDPTDIITGHIGDSGETTTSPQSIGITVGAGETIDVVVAAVAMGTDPAGRYTLACSTP